MNRLGLEAVFSCFYRQKMLNFYIKKMLNSIKQRSVQLLRWTEKWTKTDMVYIAHGGFWLGLGQFLSSLAGLITAYFFANYFPKETYGIYAYCVSWIGLFSLFALQGMNGALIQAIAKGKTGLLIPVFKERIKWALLGALVAFGFAVYYFLKSEPMLGTAFAMIGLFIPIFDPLNTYAAAVNGQKDYRTLGIYNSITRIGPMIPIVLIILFTDHLILILFTYLSAHTFFRAWLFWRTYRRLNAPKESSPETLRFGKHLSILNAISLAASEIDKVLVFQFLGPVQLAIYSFAVTPIAQLKRPTSILSTLTLPKMSGRKLEELQKHIGWKILVYSLTTISMIAIYIALAPLAFKLLFPQYLESVRYSQFLALSLLALPTTLITSAMISQSAQKSLYKTKLTLPILKISLLLILLPRFQIWGVIAATVLAEIGWSIISFFVFKNTKPQTQNETDQKSA
jgi:O-antigen/teichoic acid export membrane protein